MNPKGDQAIVEAFLIIVLLWAVDYCFHTISCFLHYNCGSHVTHWATYNILKKIKLVTHYPR